MQVRLAEKSDRDFIVTVAKVCLDAAREVSEYLENENCFLLVSEHGFLAAMVNVDSADLLDIGVLPEHRRSGEAKALIEYMQKECKNSGVDKIFLEVRTTNTAAISLYEKCGFEKISVRKDYYTAPKCDGIVMRKFI